LIHERKKKIRKPPQNRKKEKESPKSGDLGNSFAH
jgi:hypothetical protein